MGNWDAFLDN